jgi:hypothetical protein
MLKNVKKNDGFAENVHSAAKTQHNSTLQHNFEARDKIEKMPDKRYTRGCGTTCLRCWRNRLKHGNKEAKAFMKAHPELDWSVDCVSKKPARRAKQTQTQTQTQAQAQQGQKKWRRTRNKEDDRESTPQQLVAL